MPAPPATARSTVVFDLGGVLIDWDPRHLYRKLFPGDAAGMERFLAEVCTGAWNLRQDAGRPWAEATAELAAAHPGQAALIEAFHRRWPEMIAGPIAGTVEILAALRAAGTPLFALTNWSAETFPVALERFEFMAWFQGIVVSGQEGLIKPDPRIYRLLVERHGLRPEEIVYIDDNPGNAAAATALGMHGIHFTGPAALQTELASLGLLRQSG
ncbi:HAD family hydrolase [Paeniroseomonas aquatica]|uniref:HAD family phosphatase n=1 Tax=Paeniroseomonas aquatica TaxID=373043 RepID=A0ABT8AD91_9PROT|nr:HAD family phosphatase [Paeniroseomonas aquatica]MDN3567726.1 HAD family phosphatase [Paeniroseomonas aquatica]